MGNSTVGSKFAGDSPFPFMKPLFPSAVQIRAAVVTFVFLLTGARASAAHERMVVPLWSNGAPGFESRRDEPEKVINDRQTNIHNPTLTVFLPSPAKATGAAVVIAPGGGHAHLADVHEGYRVAEWLAEHGVTGFVLKYRLAKDRAQEGGSPYSVDVHALADARRALQLVRSRAREWNLNAAAIGVLGFSAGGELAILAGTRSVSARSEAEDALDRQSSRPDFVGLMYPGRTVRTDFVLHEKLPPFFIGVGASDPMVGDITAFFLAARKAGVNTEFHVYAGIGHGFGIRDVNPPSVNAWPSQFLAWLGNRNFLAPARLPHN
ncbi:MAG: alpha/beta hydrolase [Opitutus sp.]|nr:alpha/beta hydrolase [Opitutus sp.]